LYLTINVDRSMHMEWRITYLVPKQVVLESTALCCCDTMFTFRLHRVMFVFPVGLRAKNGSVESNSYLTILHKENNKLPGLSPQVNYAYRATACWRSSANICG
jgi:hypothetical protein